MQFFLEFEILDMSVICQISKLQKKEKKLNHDSSQVKSCLLGYLPDNQLLSSEIPQEK
jgi:hypothetical protein|tara:strand:- start:303 stop:476 length:174 start_codon:yes stop_codon:yes gene_type:complete